MIALYILLGLLALILLILFINVHLILIYDDGARVYLRVLFIRIDGMKLARSLGGEKKEKKKKPKPKEPEPTPKKKTKGSLSDFFDFISLISGIAKRALKDLFKSLHIRLRDLEVRFTLGEADQTALAYGASIQAANALFALLQRFSHFSWNNEKLILAPDYTGEHNVYRVNVDFWIKPVFLLSIVLRALLTYLEGKEQKHE